MVNQVVVRVFLVLAFFPSCRESGVQSREFNVGSRADVVGGHVHQGGVGVHMLSVCALWFRKPCHAWSLGTRMVLGARVF